MEVSLTLDQGSFLIIIGTNGSGKSTLLNAVAGSIPVDRGNITLDGQQITRWPEHRRASLIGRVFQNPFSGTAPTMTIAENLAMELRSTVVLDSDSEIGAAFGAGGTPMAVLLNSEGRIASEVAAGAAAAFELARRT